MTNPFDAGNAVYVQVGPRDDPASRWYTVAVLPTLDMADWLAASLATERRRTRAIQVKYSDPQWAAMYTVERAAGPRPGPKG